MIKKTRKLVIILAVLLVLTIGTTLAYFISNTEFENKFQTSAYDISIEEEFYNKWGTKIVEIVNNDSTPVALRVSYNEIWTYHYCKAYEEIKSDTEDEGRDTDVSVDMDISNIEQSNQGNMSGSLNGGLSGGGSLSGNGNLVSGTKVKCTDYGELYYNNKIDGKEAAIKEWTEEWLNDFVLGSDGWYYYKKVLNSNSNVQILNKVIKNPEIFGDDSSDRDDNMEMLSRIVVQHNMHAQYASSNYELDFNYEAVQADKKAIKELWGQDVTITDNEIEWSFN